jgi:hypothetical protein
MEAEEMHEKVEKVQSILVDVLNIKDSADVMMLHTRCILNTLDIIDKQAGREASLEVMDMVIKNLEMSKAQLVGTPQ